MKRTRTVLRGGAVLAVATLFTAVGPVPYATARADRPESISITVQSVSPSTPSPTQHQAPLTVTLTLTNRTATDLANVSVLGERGDPIATQNALDASLADPAPPTSSGLPIPAHPVVTIDLAAGTSKTVSFATTTSTVDDGKGVCLCHAGAIYPLFFSAHTLVDGVDNRLGVTATYLPVFYEKPQPVRVSWVWPLLERPHRFLDETVFSDDELAASVAGGRLDRALAVVEGVDHRIPLTLLIDPELLDELEVMANKPYTVQSADGTNTPGTGQAAASAWLDRLRTVLVAHPNVEVRLTPYADPDVEALTQRRLSWSSRMPAAMSTRVEAALAGRPLDSTLAWPVTGAISRPALHRLYRHGVRTLVLNAGAVTTTPAEEAAPSGLGRLLLRGQDVIAALTSAAIEKYAGKSISKSGEGSAAIPPLVAELAVRVAQQPDVEHAVTITAPRYADPDITAAVRTIDETSRSTFAKPISLSAAVQVQGSLVPTGYRRLARVPASATAKQSAASEAAFVAEPQMRVVRSLLDTATDTSAAALVATLPDAIQRGESSAWRQPGASGAADEYAGLLTDEFSRLDNGVHIVKPTSNSYTLASNNAPLPITVTNDLPYAVHVRIQVGTILPGFTTQDVGLQSIEANQTRTINIPATTERSGRIQIVAVLHAPNRAPLGDPVIMTVRSTALGLLGVVITVVAGVVLALALLVRVLRRLRRRRMPGPPGNAVRVGEPEPVA